ncbi:MAG: hypothetical protein PHH14_01175 [Candidatus Margulisbacteria bacterium]|nr:hypothetical protein [Candidatus Margulisiibacteriota bacterium]
MKMITSRSRPEKKIFHNEKVDVYPTKVKFENISFWKENLRTMLSFELMAKEYKKPLAETSLEDITSYLSRKRSLELVPLAKSIKQNGVRIPLIILEDGTLLDGNRRYFACSYLLSKSKEEKGERPDILDNIPVWIIKKKDLTGKIREKILAEANFVPEYKVPWPLDVKAKVISDYFSLCIKNKMTKEAAYEEIFDVYGVEKKTVDDYYDTMRLTQEFIDSADKIKADPLKKDKFREIVQEQFVYFWEFKNKSSVSTLALNAETELPELKKMFFSMMSNDRFKNIKQIEPMIRSFRDKYLWNLLIESNGSKIDQVEALYKEKKAIRSAEDKIRRFIQWLQEESINVLSKGAIKGLNELSDLCKKILK